MNEDQEFLNPFIPEDREKILAGRKNTPETKPPHTLDEMLLRGTEVTPLMRERLSPDLINFASNIMDIRKFYETQYQPQRTERLSSDDFDPIYLSRLLKDEHIKKLWQLIFSLEMKSHDAVALIEYKKQIRTLIADYSPENVHPQESVAHFLIIGTWNNFASKVYGAQFQHTDCLFPDTKTPSYQEKIDEFIRKTQPKSQPDVSIVAPGDEPEFIDSYQSPEKIGLILKDLQPGDVVHFAPKRSHPFFKFYAQLFKSIGQDRIQIHGMVVRSTKTDKFEIMSPLLTTLSDFAGIDREQLTSDKLTFSAEDINVVVREKAADATKKSTEGQIKVGDEARFRAADESIYTIKVEGCFMGWVMGTYIHTDPDINGFRTARPLSSFITP